MADDFERAFPVIGHVEGGVTTDSGGLTKFGISQRAYPNLDIHKLTLDDAKAIYRRDYWQAAHCDEMPWPLSLFVFDSAVNQGVDAAIRMLQRALGVAQDGIFGKTSLAALNKLPLPKTCSLFMAYRALRYVGTRHFDTDGKGWFKRLFVVALAAA